MHVYIHTCVETCTSIHIHTHTWIHTWMYTEPRNGDLEGCLLKSTITGVGGGLHSDAPLCGCWICIVSFGVLNGGRVLNQKLTMVFLYNIILWRVLILFISFPRMCLYTHLQVFLVNNWLGVPLFPNIKIWLPGVSWTISAGFPDHIHTRTYIHTHAQMYIYARTYTHIHLRQFT